MPHTDAAPLQATNGHAHHRSASAAVDDAVPRGIAITAAVAWRVLLIAAAGTLVVWAAMQVLVVVMPVVIAALLTTVLAPLANAMCRRGVPRSAAAAIALLAGLLVVGGLLVAVVPPFVSQAGDLGSQLNDGIRQVAHAVAQGPFGLSERQVNRAIDHATSSLDGRHLAGGLMSGVLVVGQVIAAAILTLMLTFFFVRDGNHIWEWIVGLAGPDRRPTLREAGHRAWLSLGTYFKGVAFVATVDAFFIGIALVLVGVPLAFPLIVVTFLAAFFPIIGSTAAGAAAALVALVANGLTAALIVLAAIIFVQQMEGNILYPIVVGKSLKLHAVAMLLVTSFGAVVAGVAGAFMAVPLAAIIGAVLDYARSAERHVVTGPSGPLPVATGASSLITP